MLDHNPIGNCTIGERYEADVPDTLDLAERMGLAVNALTNVWYPEEQWGLGFDVDYSRRPAVMYPSHITDAYLNIPAKFLEALTLSRLASGVTTDLEVDQHVLAAQIELIGEDGLSYAPSGVMSQFAEESSVSLPQLPTTRRNFSEIWAEGRLLLACSMLAQVDDDPRWVEIGRRKVDRILELTREKEGFRFLWTGRFRPGETVPSDADEPSRPREWGSLASNDPIFEMIYAIGATGHGAGLFHRVTGHEPARELSRGLARWALARVFNNEDGSYNFWHFHHGLYALMAVCEYGHLEDDSDILERVDACYRFMREMGDPLIGFFPEGMPGSDWYLARRGNSVEICEITDMVFLALYLTRAGIGDYWDDVDRWVRNMYAEGQVRDTDFLASIPEGYFNPEPSTRLHVDDRDIAERSVGSFLGWMRANEGLTVNQTPDGPKLFERAIMHCCTANGARTLFFAWDSIVTKSGDDVRVNLLLNRASPWLDVVSFVPAEGKVVLRIKDAPRVSVRMPDWCDPSGVRVSVGGEDRRGLVDGRWLRVGWLTPGDAVELTFPMPKSSLHRVIGEMPYKLTLRGSQVVGIDPKGVAMPLFNDPPTGRTARKTLFVPEIRDVIW